MHIEHSYLKNTSNPNAEKENNILKDTALSLWNNKGRNTVLSYIKSYIIKKQ